ncbi:MAG: HK97 gp10 family phage protein [Desulfurobacteriaceae bacterium]
MSGVFGFDKLNNWIEKNLKEFKQRRQRVLKDMATLAQKVAVENAPHDTGTLRRSIQIEYGEGWAVVGTNLEYAPAHEFGATIKPFKAKYLAIPVSKQIRKKVEKFGSVRAYLSAMKMSGYSVFIRDGVIFIQKGNVKPKPQFKLRKQVKIKPKRFFEKAKTEVAEKFPSHTIKTIVRGK